MGQFSVWQEVHRPVAVSLCPPAVRMLVIEATASWDGAEIRTTTSFLPVVALQSRIVKTFGKERSRERPDYAGWGSEKELLADGWDLTGQELTQTALIVDPELGLVAFDDPARAGRKSALVAAPWAPEEDERRLAEVVTRLTREAIEDAQRERPKHDRGTAKKPTTSPEDLVSINGQPAPCMGGLVEAE